MLSHHSSFSHHANSHNSYNAIYNTMKIKFILFIYCLNAFTHFPFSINAKICSYSGYCSNNDDCIAGNNCQKFSQFYSQCVPDLIIQKCAADYGPCNKLVACCPSSNCTKRLNSNDSNCIPLPCTSPSGFSTQFVQFNNARPHQLFFFAESSEMNKGSFSGSLVRYHHIKLW